jgi:hypothetical protein
MIAHLVLFRPRADLTQEARVGRRVLHGRPYESVMKEDYQYAAVVEFDDVAGLNAYLQHPSHEQLASRFFAAFEQALIYDFDLKDGTH